MMEVTIKSARSVGVVEPFHVWSSTPVAGAINHQDPFGSKTSYWFKFECLKEFVKLLPYDFFVWIDADSYFVRNPGNVLTIMQGDPVHSSLESDASSILNVRPDWWGCPLSIYVCLMRQLGVASKAVFNVNAGFWVVHRDAIDTFYDLAYRFLSVARKYGYDFTEEPPLAYATHMLCSNPSLHILRSTSEYWASDWTGHYADRLPDGMPWNFQDYFTEESFSVNPAIVHAMRSKSVLAAKAGL